MCVCVCAHIVSTCRCSVIQLVISKQTVVCVCMCSVCKVIVKLGLQAEIIVLIVTLLTCFLFQM